VNDFFVPYRTQSRTSLSRLIGRTAAACCFCLLALVSTGCSESSLSTSSSTVPLWGDYPNARPTCVKGVHLTSWYAGSKKRRAKIETLLSETELNTVVIDVKEVEGDVFAPGVTLNGKPNYVAAIPDLKEYLSYLKARGVFTIARITCFHDEKLTHLMPDWAIHSSTPLALATEHGYRKDVWVDHKGTAWADPYNQAVGDYLIGIAERAVDAGFQGIQFDYIRFPSDGPTRLCVYSQRHTPKSAVRALVNFLHRAHDRLKPRNVELSIDVFGLTGSYDDDLGIGQKLSELLTYVDVISPMMYPSHYAPGEFGLKSPNNSPYQTVSRSVEDTMRVLGAKPVQLRPYLQDFSLGVKYTPQKVRAQIEATMDHGVNEWILWNAACRYTKEALEPRGQPTN